MTPIRVLPLSDDLVPAAAKRCADGLRETAARLDPVIGVAPMAAPEPLAEAALRRYLEGDPDRAAWVALDSHSVLGCVGAVSTTLTPDDGRYTYLPPASVSAGLSTFHVTRPSGLAALPALLREVRRHADRTAPGIPAFVAAAAADTAATNALRDLGAVPSSVMAWRGVEAPDLFGHTADGVAVRVAADRDLDALTELALEEHLHHAHHTSSGVSRDQPRATSFRLAAEIVAAEGHRTRQLVAEDESGAVVGCITGSIQHLADEDVQRFLLPPVRGYIGLTSVTAAARGRGVARSMLDALLRWFAHHDVSRVFLHYQADNDLAARLWTRTGFVPHLVLHALPVAAFGPA